MRFFKGLSKYHLYLLSVCILIFITNYYGTVHLYFISFAEEGSGSIIMDFYFSSNKKKFTVVEKSSKKKSKRSKRLF